MPFNLLHDFSKFGPFDVVFCRNVLIYFDQETKIGVLDRIAKVTERDGFLVLGGAETVVGLTERFKPVPGKRGVYAQPGAAPESNVIHLNAAPPIAAAAAARR
jgi:chemotaxis protein methyltransferase CheR